MGIKTKVILFIILGLYFAYHLLTLPLNPLPWFDETFFASISRSYAETGRLIPQISQEMWQGQEIFIYGPVFFFIESICIKLFGFGIFQYRIIPFLFGILTISATFSLLKEYCHTIKWPYLALVAFALDPFINLSMHEGRMDLVAAFFMVMSVLCMRKAGKHSKHLCYFISGLFAVLSLLTTPRSGIIFISIFLLILVTTIRQPPRLAFQLLLWWLLPVISLYALWTYYAFGGLKELISYYQNLRDTNAEYIGGLGYIPKHEIVLIPLTIVTVSLAIVIKGNHYFNTAVKVSLLSILLFYLLVLDWGPYSALILPFYYFLLFYSLDKLQHQGKNFPIYLGALLLIFNASYFTLKAAHIISEVSIRRLGIAEQFIKKHIPPGSKVCGDAQYYYAVVMAGSDYRLYDAFLSLEERERLLHELYAYQYLIISERSLENEPGIREYFMQQALLTPIAQITGTQPSFAAFLGGLGIISNAERYGYNAIIYQRKSNLQ